jgi:hypothetical protein
MTATPRRHPRFLALLLALLVLTVPWPFIGRETTFGWGLPLWLWWSLGWTAALASATAWGILRLWTDDEEPP